MPRLLYAAWAVAGTSLLLLGASLVPRRALHEIDGFARAVQAAAARADAATLIVVWPPEHAAALASIPAPAAATDAVPLEAPEARRWRRLLVIGPEGFDDPRELAAASAGPRESFGDVELAPFHWAARDRVLFDLRDGVSRARVLLRGAGGELHCDRALPGGGFGCPGRPDWTRVAPDRLRVGGDDWPCVWAHPVEAHELVVDLGEQQLGDRVELDAALADSAAGTPGGAAVQIDLELDGVGRRTLWRSNAPGVVALAMDTPRRRAGVRLMIRAAQDGRRHLGLNLRIVERP